MKVIGWLVADYQFVVINHRQDLHRFGTGTAWVSSL